MCLPLLCGGAPPGGAPQTKPRSTKPNHPSSAHDGACIAKSSSYYVRNRCEGFLTVKDRRVLIQKEGMNISHPAAAIVKESCSGEIGRQLVRYRHLETNTYICFTKKGAVKAVDARKVDGRGTLCMFVEEAVDSLEAVEAATYHTLRSVHNARWYLGLGAKERRRGTHAASPSFSPARRLVRPPADFCGAHFSSGRHGPPPAKPFFGVFDLVSDYMDGSSRVNLKNTLAAKNSDFGGQKSRSDFSKEEFLLSSTTTSLSSSSSLPPSEDGSYKSSDEEDVVVINNDDRKISKAHLEALRMQHQLTRHRIRHAKHKRPRPSREEKAAARMAQLEI